MLDIMSNSLYPLIVQASCGHFMPVTSKEQQDAFEVDHQDRCDADDVFREEALDNPFYSSRRRYTPGHRLYILR